MKAEWNNQLLIPIRERQEIELKHLLVKTLLAFAIKLKYKGTWQHQRIYSEFDLNGSIPDVYHENMKSKKIICYEIQYNISDKYIKEKNKFYNNYHQLFFKVDWQLIKLRECPDDIEDIWKWIKQSVI